MKNKIICLAVLVLSLIAFAASFNRTQAYYYNNKGNSFFKEMKFQEAQNEYNKSLEIRENSEVRNNIIKSLYEEKKYKEITETLSTEYFIRGNSYAFLGDETAQQNPEEAIKNYKTALEEYKLAMKTSNDLNIKKNYEIVLKKIEALNNNQNQQSQDKQNDKQDQNNEQDNKQNQQNQDKQNNKQDQNKDQDNKQDQQNNQNQQNQDKQNDKQDQNKDQDNKQDQQNNQNQQNQDKQNDKQDQNKDQNDKQNSIPQGEVQPIDSKDEGRDGEVRAILKRLEGNEKQSFKNNERVINIDTGNSNNRW